MPNLNCEISLPKGHFFTCDTNVEYQQIQFTQSAFDKTNLTIYYGHRNGEQYFKISDQDRVTISLLRLLRTNLVNTDFYKVSKVGTKSEHRLNGYAYQLYLTALERLDLPILSDATLTIPGSYNIWAKLLHDSRHGNIEIKSLNTKTNKINKYSYKNPKTRIWGYDPDILNIIKEDKENLNEAYADGQITKELYEFVRDNLRLLGDRRHLRLVVEKV